MKIAQELLDRSQVYFNENPKLDKMIATTDGHYFFPGSEHFAKGHALGNNNVMVVEITRDQAFAKEVKEIQEPLEVEKKSLSQMNRAELKEECIKLNIQTSGTIKELRYRIKEAQSGK